MFANVYVLDNADLRPIAAPPPSSHRIRRTGVRPAFAFSDRNSSGSSSDSSFIHAFVVTCTNSVPFAADRLRRRHRRDLRPDERRPLRNDRRLLDALGEPALAEPVRDDVADRFRLLLRDRS